IPGRITTPSSTGSSGSCIPAPPGGTCRGVTGPGRPSTTASIAGAGTGPGPASSPGCSATSSAVAASAPTSGASAPRSSAPPAPPGGRKKNPGRSRALAGPKAAQLKEPPDHALGYSRGGFSTKVHLVCDRHGILLAIYLTPGQRHDSKGFEPVAERV